MPGILLQNNKTTWKEVLSGILEPYVFIFILYVWVFFFLPAYMSEHTICACGDQKRVLDTLELGVIDGYELPWWCWEPNLGPLQE